jgi:hypothetical protein
MFPESYLSDLRSNGPIVHMPNWQSPSSPLPLPPEEFNTPPLPPDRNSAVAGEDRGEAKTACAGTPSPSPLPNGEGFESAIAGNPQSKIVRRGRPKALDEDKKATVCSLIAAGVGLRQAGRFVDCDPNSIRREARRNRDFRRQLAKARSEASIHPLQTLRQAAKTNWRAALCWMERLDPQRFARPDASVVTKRESNQFVADLVESIERAISDPRERSNLFELLSAAMPAAMRRRWDGHGSRRNLKQAMRDFDKKRNEEVAQRAKRRREFTSRIASYLPWQLIRELGDYHDVLDPDVIRADRTHAAARRNRAPEEPQNDDAPANDSPLKDGSLDDGATNSGPAEDGSTNVGPTNNASPGENFVTPPRRNSDNVASPPHANHQPANDLQQPGEAKFAE